jgi:isopenicillin N synthase-like dioxygenase
MFTLCLTVFQILAHGMPYGPNVFDDFVREPCVTVGRLLHYPPQAIKDARQLGAGAHTDFGAITLLLTDDQPGLEVLDQAAATWVPVAPNPDAYVVNMGGMMQRWTKGQYKSNVHRVLNHSTNHRYSVPFFFDGNMACKLAPFDGSELDSSVLTADEHMRERFATTTTVTLDGKQ